jgi:hypothetical protein
LELWKGDLKNTNEKIAEALADPIKYPNLFPDYEWALKVNFALIYFSDFIEILCVVGGENVSSSQK